MEEIKITVIGAGVVGLSIAAELAKEHGDLFVVEQNPMFGQETSSRNSEVIHAGIYYPKDSLKAKTCIEGRELLYRFCAENKVAHKRTEKLIVAVDKGENKELESLYKNGLENGLDDLRLLSRQELKKIEPNVEAAAAIYSSSTGILDSHGLMKKLADYLQGRKGQIAYDTKVIGIDKAAGGFEVTVEDKREGPFKFFTRVLINSAGLQADKIAAMLGLAKEEYRLKYCKGDYFRVHSGKAKFINRLVYPVPKEDRAGLGIHATLDLGGGLRLGPDDEYIDRIDYDIDPAKAKPFHESIRTFLPFIQLADLAPDTSGIRPKLQGKLEPFRDFVIKDEADNGLAGFIDLVGIESPGLTASLSIAKLVKNLVKNYC
ncbi:MAG: NAD(P)/FAD-dependent oxidoreductase [Candidatus Omnitrophica bacterium]|nr:NAD(P)/FAD-dependent oxidoreductase [Candidatus Omnitrophota bacterium]